eukprot:scaffold112965_cov50-Attheya_sp.AAC.1
MTDNVCSGCGVDENDAILICHGRARRWMPSSSDKKTKNVLKMIRWLVIQSTIEFDVDDWEDMTGFLADHHGITDLADILDHFYYNRGDNIVSVHDLILANPVLKVAWTPVLEQYFDNPLEEMARKGHTGGS